MKGATMQPPLEPVVEVELSAKRETAIAERPLPEASIAVFERLATDPNVDPDKLERLIAMQERILAHQAKAVFDEAFAAMQGKIPVITERGAIEVNGVVRSKYATNEDIQEVIRPILAEYGFSLRFRNVTDGGKHKTIGILSHKSGHQETDEFESIADSSGSKNSVQAIGSIRAYGQRYTTIALVNIATRGQDDDGRAAGRPEPDGYQDWRDTLVKKAAEGLPALQQMWTVANGDKALKVFAEYLTKTEPHTWRDLKSQAAKVVAK